MILQDGLRTSTAITLSPMDRTWYGISNNRPSVSCSTPTYARRGRGREGPVERLSTSQARQETRAMTDESSGRMTLLEQLDRKKDHIGSTPVYYLYLYLGRVSCVCIHSSPEDTVKADKKINPGACTQSKRPFSLLCRSVYFHFFLLKFFFPCCRGRTRGSAE